MRSFTKRKAYMHLVIVFLMYNFQEGANLYSISFAQLSRWPNVMNPVTFQQRFLDLVSQIHQRTNYSKITLPLKIIDSSTLPLNLTNHQ
jgi:hypothetical protein